MVCGGTGQIGQSIIEQANTRGIRVIAPSSQTLDITDSASVSDALERYQPTLIINAAAYTNVDGAETDAARAFAINADGVRHLAVAAHFAAIPLFHISTDYVFSGKGNEPITESHPTGPCSVYGASKLAGEQAIIESAANHIVLRTSWVYGMHGHNFVKTMLRLGREQPSVSIVNDQVGCPTYAASIASVLLELCSRYVEKGDLPWGIYHYSGRSACSWYEFAREIFSQAGAIGVLEKAPHIQAVSTDEYPTPSCRPAWSVLDCQRFESTFGITTLDWREELYKCLSLMAASGCRSSNVRLPIRFADMP
ncbi:dTDP-4-dehydrorhamnose reductase [Stutzerimonas xanthomarina]|uniref:dTDP-4-dehydrorhamnose reductase n=2 Tax=Stutzerimonas xanthomarina TaxID=271420 RepID=A0A1M5PLR8_9GAMM|nr:dTDP-4-dehydrorhamnose reductase [Stutzerimonas xanthomarina]SHH02681.1 dTDP-4-dehydrorhamnose reductase [Stutzerimonas xanthomarina DSM 18231]